MSKNLVIVESPAKAKTIEKILGADFKVMSSFGHIADLPNKTLAIDIENNYRPEYEISPDKKDLVRKLKEEAKKSDIIWLASDEDREGEAISWHLYNQLKLEPEKTKRIAFHEITKSAILKAIDTPRAIDLNLVNAQQARRVLDRLVGYEMSPVLWKKIKTGLSAGRVQSVAVRLIVEREREIQAFNSAALYKVTAVFTDNKHNSLKAELDTKFETENQALEFLESCLSSEFSVGDITKKPSKRSPSAPFTTSTLQQEASLKLGFSVSQTMSLAQKLYEAGHITYMRTDSVNLSEEALKNIKNEIEKSYGSNYHKLRKFQTKSKGAQEAHEAIRPTYPSDMVAGGDEREKKLYKLIWQRSVASQMQDAELERTDIHILIKNRKETFLSSGEVLLFDGFLKVYGYSVSSDEDEDKNESQTLLPKLEKGEQLSYKEIKAEERYSKAPARYSEASLVKKLEELGIGRPSTYAPTISTIQRREYVEKGDSEGQKRTINFLTLEKQSVSKASRQEVFNSNKGRLVPTDMGVVVNDFLCKHFEDILDYKFTAQAEEDLDDIAQGKLDWVKSIDVFYKDFHKNIEKVSQTAERASGERLLGTHPENGKQVSVRIGRFGPLVQIGNSEDQDKQFASLQKTQSIETITLKEALELFKLPRTIGEYKEKAVSAAIGRFGPYVKWGSVFVSLKVKEGDNPMTVSLERAAELIEEKLNAEANKTILHFQDVEPNVYVLNGRYGPYISIDKQNYKIPKTEDPKQLTLEKCLEIAQQVKASPKKAVRKSTTTKKSTTKKTK